MITVLLFAHLQDVTGPVIEVDNDQMTVGELKDRLQKTHQFPPLDSILVSINEEYAFQEDVIRSGDVVALIPPVSGG